MPATIVPPRATGPASSGLALVQAALLAVAVLYFGRELFIPLALAVLLAFVLAPVVRLLRQVHLPRVPAVLLSVALAFSLILGLGALLGRQVSLLADNLPIYQITVQNKLAGLRDANDWLDRLTGTLQRMRSDATPAAPQAPTQPSAAPAPRPIPVEIHAPEPGPIQTLQAVVSPLLGPLAMVGIVLILVIFILLYREDLRDRLIRLAGARDLHRTMAAMDDAAYRLSRYFLAQTGLNAGFGLFITISLWIIGIPNPLLWGVVAGLARFIPFIGSYLAAAFPAVLALAVDPGWSMLLSVVVLFVVSELIMGQVLEPWIFGHSTGLSPIAVVAAATFWTWLWGPVGLLLSVPLTVCLVVLGRHVDRLEFLEVALGDQPALDPEELFYQRALAGDTDALTEQAEHCLKDKPLAEYLDAVAMPALRLAQQDAARGSLAEERMDTFRRSLCELIEDLEDTAPESESPPPAKWQAPGAVLCMGGRGPLDAMAAGLFAQALAAYGFGVQQGGLVGPPVGGSASVAPMGPAAPPRLICLTFIEGGSSSASARTLVRRQRRRLPGVPVLALAWQAAPDGGLAQVLRAEDVRLSTSLVDALEQADAMAAEGTLSVGPVVPRPPPEPPTAEGLVPAPA
jgi:predicted PurR-regulated permease PerM